MNRKSKTEFRSFADFYKFYLKEHSKAKTRIFHCIGTLGALIILSYAIYEHAWWLILAAVVVGYGFAWGSHILIQKNRPATIQQPLYSFLGDFRMLFETLIGKLPLTRDL